MKKVIVLSFSTLLLIGLLALFLLPQSAAAEQKYPARGRYIYDEAGRLTTESALALSSYLWQIDLKTNYELVIVLPEKKFSDQEIISWFNKHGVGKRGLDNGAALFVFPDNSWFMSIGSGNDKISVPHAKTYGDKILKNLEDELVLSLLRYIEALNQQIETAIEEKRGSLFEERVLANLDLILLWALVVALAVFLYRQKDGFQKHDLILPCIFFIALGIFLGIGALNDYKAPASSTDYGIITATKLDTRRWVQVISTGKTTMVIHHIDYINYSDIQTYGLKSGKYKFVSTDNKEAWQYRVGDFVALTINIKTGEIRSAGRFNDFSGGKTIGDGVWGEFKKLSN